VVDGVLNGTAYQSTRAHAAHDLDADAGVGENLDAHLVEKTDDTLGTVGVNFELDAGVDVFSIFAENDHVEVLGRLDHGGHAGEVAHGADALVKVEGLAHGHVETAHATTGGGVERSLDGNAEGLDGGQGVVRKGFAELGFGFVTGENFQPGDAAFAAIGAGDGCIEDEPGGTPDLLTDTIAFDERNDRTVRRDRFACQETDGFAGWYWYTVVFDRFCAHSLLPSSEQVQVMLVRASAVTVEFSSCQSARLKNLAHERRN